MVECFNSKQFSQLLHTTELLKTQVKVTPFTPTIGSKGVIKGIDNEIMEEDVKVVLEHYNGPTQVKRIVKRIKGEIVPTKAMILTFKTKSIPTEVSLGYKKKQVFEYQQQVSCCFHCQRYGHAAGSCGAPASTVSGTATPPAPVGHQLPLSAVRPRRQLWGGREVLYLRGETQLGDLPE